MKQGDIAMIAQVARKSKPRGIGLWNASESPKKFIPKNPARNDIGKNITVTIVKVFMMSLVRFDTTDK
jgi:hypothetical protein